MKAFDPRLQGVYAVTDNALCKRRGVVASAACALAGGARLVQYRDKSQDDDRRLAEAKQLSRLCKAHEALLIINDDIALAQAAGAHGVHLGREDAGIVEARALLGPDAIIGFSCYDDFARAEAGARAGMNYVAFGSVFPSPTKPEAVRAPLALFERAREELAVPACAIGGINHENIGAVTRAGAAMAAVVSAIFAAEDIERATRRLVTAMSSSAP